MENKVQTKENSLETIEVENEVQTKGNSLGISRGFRSGFVFVSKSLDPPEVRASPGLKQKKMIKKITWAAKEIRRLMWIFRK